MPRTTANGSPTDDLERRPLGQNSRQARHTFGTGSTGRENGFTLIELLVVVVIIGVLIAIAIPLYLNYRKGANDKAAQSDVRNAIVVLETCNSDNGSYPTLVTTAGNMTGCPGLTIKLSPGTSIVYSQPSSTTYMILGYNSGGNTSTNTYGKETYCYNSAVGGSVKDLPGTTVTC